jgi:hypothetical protein
LVVVGDDEVVAGAVDVVVLLVVDVLLGVELLLVVEVPLVDEVLVDDVVAISASACFVAVCAAVVESTPDFSVWMDCPRLLVGAGEVAVDGSTIVILPSAPIAACRIVPSGFTVSPVICSFSCSNGIPRLFETFVAATNWPRFLKPYAAWYTEPV